MFREHFRLRFGHFTNLLWELISFNLLIAPSQSGAHLFFTSVHCAYLFDAKKFNLSHLLAKKVTARSADPLPTGNVCEVVGAIKTSALKPTTADQS